MAINQDFFRWIEDKWDRQGAAYLLPIATFFISFSSLVTTVGVAWAATVATILSISVFCGWYISHRPPKVAHGRIGFGLAVLSESESEQQRVSQDLVRSLRDIFDDFRGVADFQIIEFPKYHALKITDVKTALKYVKRTRCHFLAFGTVRTRQRHGQNYFILTLRDLVVHKPVPLNISKLLQGEMNSILPRKVEIDCKDDLRGFEITSTWFAETAKFVIGTAALVSNDLELAERLLVSLYERRFELHRQRKLLGIKSLLKRLPTRLFDAYNAQVTRYILEWRASRSLEHIARVREYGLKIRNCAPNSESSYLALAICHFVDGRNVKAAMEELRFCEKKRIPSASWRMSMAFLFAYQGDLTTAKRYYKAAFRFRPPDALPFEVEEFIVWVVEDEPDKYQLYYCLGLINLELKGDHIATIGDWERFQRGAEGKAEYASEIAEVDEKLAVLRAEIGDLDRAV